MLREFHLRKQTKEKARKEKACVSSQARRHELCVVRLLQVVLGHLPRHF